MKVKCNRADSSSAGATACNLLQAQSFNDQTKYSHVWNEIYEGIQIFTLNPVLENNFKADLMEECCVHTLLFFLNNKAHGDITLSYNSIMLSEDKRWSRRNCTNFCPCWIFPPFPRAADQEVWYITVFYFFFFFCVFLVPCSSSVFTNVSVDHWLHLMERVFAAWVIQLGVYHRALENRNEKRPGEKEKRSATGTNTVYPNKSRSREERRPWWMQKKHFFYCCINFKLIMLV